MTFYTYLWLREDGTPYYVGKGTGKRAFRSSNHNLSAPVRELIIIQEFENEIDAFTAEKFLISFYGRKDTGTGILRNFSDGGDGASGRIVTAEMRLAHSNRMRGRASWNRGKQLSQDHRIKIREAKVGKASPLRGIKLSVERRAQMCKERKGKRNDVAERNKTKVWTEEARLHMSIKKRQSNGRAEV